MGKTALATTCWRTEAGRPIPRCAALPPTCAGPTQEHRLPVLPADATCRTSSTAFNPEGEAKPEELDRLTPIYLGVLNEAGRVLLFLDNAADGEQVRPLLPPANCLLLVTSRKHFTLPGMVTCGR